MHLVEAVTELTNGALHFIRWTEAAYYLSVATYFFDEMGDPQ